MPDGNGNYDWRERMARLETSIEKNWADHDRINGNIDDLHASMTAQKENVDKLLVALYELIDGVPPENLPILAAINQLRAEPYIRLSREFDI